MWPFLFFPWIHSGAHGSLVVGGVVGLAIHAFMYGPQAAFISEQFEPRLSATGSSLAYTFAGLIGGAVAPLLFTVLLQASHTSTWIAVYVAAACAVTLIGLGLGRDPAF